MREVKPDVGDVVVFATASAQPRRLEHFRSYRDWREPNRCNVTFWEYSRPGVEHGSTNATIARVIAYVGID